nr:DUF21 domain-containing protein At4g14240-like [Ipomoea batatas]
MSGLTLGLMSLGLVELEILQRSGTPTEKKQAATIFPVVQKQHQLLVTLLLCNAASMEPGEGGRTSGKEYNRIYIHLIDTEILHLLNHNHLE